MIVVRFGILILGIGTALGLLALLLLLATAPHPILLQQAETRTQHLYTTLESVETFLLSRTPYEQKITWDDKHLALADALDRSNIELVTAIQTAHDTSTVANQVRDIGIDAINFADMDLSGRSNPDELTARAETLFTRIESLIPMLGEFQEARTDFVARLRQFEDTSNELLTQLRQSGDSASADTVYVTGQKIISVVTTGTNEELNGVFTFISQLEAIESQLPQSQKEPLRRLVDTTYLLNGIKRTMNQSVENMQLSSLVGQIEYLRTQLSSDQIYTAGAVSDARILLNISTVLLLALLAFMGRRLQVSYAALNLSHDDLERRIEERTEELQQTNHDLKESQVQLVQAEKLSSLGQLVAGVMHEINTPLLYVQNNTTMTSTSVQEISEFVKLALPLLKTTDSQEIAKALNELTNKREDFDADEMLENLEEVEALADDSLDGLAQISELVQSLKDFSRLDRVADDKFDVREGIEKTLVITRNLLKQGVEVKKDLQSVPEIYCSPSRLNQVFINLVTNAVQAMEGQGTLSISTRWLQSERGDSVEVCFEDTGCGIPEEHLNKILDPFFTTKPVGQGTGLGLSIVHQIVEQHEGQILVDSKVGVGTRITLNFPIRPSANKAQEEAA